MLKSLLSLGEIFRPIRRDLSAAVGLIFLHQVLSATVPFFIGHLVDYFVNGGPVESAYAIVGAISIVLFLEKAVMPCVRGILEIRRVDYAMIALATQHILRKVFRLSISQHTSQNSGRRTSIIKRGESAMIDLSFIVLYQILPMTMLMGVLVAALFYKSLVLGSVVLVGVGLYMYLMARFNNACRPDLRTIEKNWNQDDKLETEFVRHAPMIIANSQEQRVYREMAVNWDKLESFGIPFWVRYELGQATRRLLLVTAEISVIFLVLWYHQANLMTAGELVMCWGWARNALNQAAAFGDIQRNMVKQVGSIERMVEMINEPPDVVPPEYGLKPYLRGEIEFNNVIYFHERRKSREDEVEPDGGPDEQDSPVLKNISFRVEAGQTVAIVGKSGAGKSTLVQALLRARDPLSGEILLDGQPLKDLDLEHYRTQVGTVEQSVVMFDNTLRYNLTFGLQDPGAVTLPELDRICKTACVDDFHHRLENGYDTFIGERGVRLSGGEGQRVGIARALLKNPRILILDEATSNLDAENEHLFKQALEASAQGRTTLIIAHRLSTVRNADRILVMHEGELIAQGIHEDLMRDCPVYWKLVKTQIENQSSLEVL